MTDEAHDKQANYRHLFNLLPYCLMHRLKFLLGMFAAHAF